MRTPSSVMKLVAVTVAVGLVGAYVGYRVLRADARVADSTLPAPAALPGKVTAPRPFHLPPLETMGGSKSEAIIEVKDIESVELAPPGAPSPAPDAGKK